MLSDAISRIFSERASFELRDDDVEALRLQLRNGNISHGKGKRDSPPSQQKEVEEAAQWKVILARRKLLNTAGRSAKNFVTAFLEDRLTALYVSALDES